MLKNNLKKVKRTKFWYYIVFLMVKPLFEIFWKYLINFHGFVLKKIWFFKKRRDFISLEKNDKKIIYDQKEFIQLANEIYKQFDTNLLNKINLIIKKGLITQNKSNHGKKTYTIDTFEFLSAETKQKIFNLATSDLMISTAANYLGVFPILSRILVNFNIPNDPDDQRGAMLWHRDDFGYKSLDLFLSITDVDENNGPFFSLAKPLKLGTFSNFDTKEIYTEKGYRGKIDDKDFSKPVNKYSVINNMGKSGTGVIIDSFSSFHKGGGCKQSHRIMLRISYQTIDSISLKKQENNFLNFDKVKKNETKDIFLKYMLFKRSMFFEKIRLPSFLLYLYRLFQFKESL